MLRVQTSVVTAWFILFKLDRKIRCLSTLECAQPVHSWCTPIQFKRKETSHDQRCLDTEHYFKTNNLTELRAG